MVHDGVEPPVYLVLEVPALAIALIGDESDGIWLTMALGAPRFSADQEDYAQQFMRRHSLDQQQFSDLHPCASAVREALRLELAGA